MRLRAGLVIVCGLAALTLPAAPAVPSFESSILNVLNQLRLNPASFLGILQQRRLYYYGNLLELPGQPTLITQEGPRPLMETIDLLPTINLRLGRVTPSAGLARAAADHVFDTGRLGLIGHASANGGDFSKRISRYGKWSGAIGEEINYGANDAREVILELLIDDGVPSRGHRKSLFDPRWRYVGIACGPHSRYGTMCVLDFASNYRER